MRLRAILLILLVLPFVCLVSVVYTATNVTRSGPRIHPEITFTAGSIYVTNTALQRHINGTVTALVIIQPSR